MKYQAADCIGISRFETINKKYNKKTYVTMCTSLQIQIQLEPYKNYEMSFLIKIVSRKAIHKKRRSFKFMKNFWTARDLTRRQRKIMTNGLSFILDLSDNSLASRRSLFNEREWNEIQPCSTNSITPYQLTKAMVIMQNPLQLQLLIGLKEYRSCPMIGSLKMKFADLKGDYLVNPWLQKS
ncbi:uncharacterized protein EV154DRAFT_299548 [Mucor mucedo]|uniref:uncharacterized protein n=1 Tax=Mucor mucedo TaxID=29922 RepID=UPI00221F0131|nr:uncharacterized protein EV154DRAFT_299548 [Mucor mucedo]KAI7895942.1 hypothetical protein EV154DRAFT_299548 [Mucor mucedo]